MNVDIVQICTDPLLQSIYAEILRVRTGTVLMRIPTESNFQIDGWHFRKDEPIIVSSYDTARDKSVWNAGTVDDAHPLDEFWEERFIIYPDKINSGPVNQTVLPPKTYDKPTFSLDGTSGSWLPYGGGSRMCPGRYFAREEITVAGAMFLAAFDVELLTGSNKFVEPDMHYYMFGTMHPKGPIPARIRKRLF
jgi:cytochrome P450